MTGSKRELGFPVHVGEVVVVYRKEEEEEQ